MAPYLYTESTQMPNQGIANAKELIAPSIGEYFGSRKPKFFVYF